MVAKTYTIVYKDSVIDVNEIKSIIDSYGFMYNEQNPNYVFSFGGDGTFIDAKNIAVKFDSIIVGFNYGNLGHYNEFKKGELERVLSSISERKVKEYYLLKINDTEYAINELSIINPTYSVYIDVYHNEKLFEKYQGSGMAISSPTGSTALNKSLGGPMILSNVNVFTLTPIAPIDNNYFSSLTSPIVFSGDDKVKLVITPLDGTIVNIDGYQKNFDSECVITIARKKLRVLENEENNKNLISKSFIRGEL